MFIGVLIVAWALLSPLIGMAYKWLRIIETASLWQFTDYGTYFMGTPFPKEYEFWSIFWSSLPFGLTFIGLIVLLGFHARDRILNEHIDATIQHKDGIGLTPEKLMHRMSKQHPHNEFYLNFPLTRYKMEGGAASMPLTAIQLLIEANAINIQDKSDLEDGDGFSVDKARVRDALEARFGPQNPFLGLNWNDPSEIEQTVLKLDWPTVVLLYACLARIDALVCGVGDEYEKALTDIDEYMKSIWRCINKEYDKVRRSGKQLAIGPYEVDLGDDLPDREFVLLADHLREHAPNFPPVRTARVKLSTLLTKPMSQARGASKLNGEIERIFKRHGFLFGVLATALVETRFAGVFNPAIFNWLRFYDCDLWRFLNYIGMNTPCPEAAGMFDHWQMENMSQVSLRKPEISVDTIDNIIREARKYTPKNLRIADTSALAAEINNASESARDMMEQFSD